MYFGKVTESIASAEMTAIDSNVSSTFPAEKNLEMNGLGGFVCTVRA
jgi:hypothetical protein